MSSEPPADGTYLPVLNYLEILSGEEPEPQGVVADALQMASEVLAILREYNVRDLCPNELAELSRRLYDVGALGLGEYAVLSFQPHLWDEYEGFTEVYRMLQDTPDIRRDMISAWEDHVAELARSMSDPRTFQLSNEVLHLLRSFEPMEDESDGPALTD